MQDEVLQKWECLLLLKDEGERGRRQSGWPREVRVAGTSGLDNARGKEVRLQVLVAGEMKWKRYKVELSDVREG